MPQKSPLGLRSPHCRSALWGGPGWMEAVSCCEQSGLGTRRPAAQQGGQPQGGPPRRKCDPSLRGVCPRLQGAPRGRVLRRSPLVRRWVSCDDWGVQWPGGFIQMLLNGDLNQWLWGPPSL